MDMQGSGRNNRRAVPVGEAQRRLLEAASPLPAETREVVEAVIAERSDVTVEAEHHWWPHTDGTDAMYLALLRRS